MSSDDQRSPAHDALGKVEAGVRRAVAPVAQRAVRGHGGEVGDDATVVHQAITVRASPEELAAVLHDPATLRRVAAGVEVEDVAEDVSRWTVTGPLDLRITSDVRRQTGGPEQPLRWETVPGGDLAHAGVVTTKAAREDWGTELHVEIRVQPPGGVVGKVGEGWLRTAVGAAATVALRRLKSQIETGEIPTLAGSPSARETTA